MTAPRTVSFDDTSIAFASRSNAELLKMYWLFALMNNNFLVKNGTPLLAAGIKIGLPVKFLVKPTIFSHFCGGETIQECESTIQQLGKYGVGTILDYSVEGEKNEATFDATANEIIATIDKAATTPAIPFSVFKVTGVAHSDLLQKAQDKKPLSSEEQAALDRAWARVDRICKHAHDKKVRIFIDAEETWLQDVIDDMADTMMERYNERHFIVYNTYQLYRHDRLEAIKKAYKKAQLGGYLIGGKLVRGAYMEKERKVAQAAGKPDPINPSKKATDDLFNEALRFCIERLDRIAICAGTHNEESTYLLMDLMRQHHVKPSDDRIYFAQLLGMSDNISFNLAKAGYNVAKYVPYGPVEAVMPYLIRRANENTAIAGQSSREFNLIKKERERRKQAK